MNNSDNLSKSAKKCLRKVKGQIGTMNGLGLLIQSLFVFQFQSNVSADKLLTGWFYKFSEQL